MRKQSAADVKMEISVLVRSLKSNILSSSSFKMVKTFWGVVSAAVEQPKNQHGRSGRREIRPQRLTPESQGETSSSTLEVDRRHKQLNDWRILRLMTFTLFVNCTPCFKNTQSSISLFFSPLVILLESFLAACLKKKKKKSLFWFLLRLYSLFVTFGMLAHCIHLSWFKDSTQLAVENSCCCCCRCCCCSSKRRKKRLRRRKRPSSA